MPIRSPRPLPAALRPRGFALVEVILALVMLSCGALALVAATGAAIRSTSAAESQSAATAAARSRVETLAARGCSSDGEDAGADSSGWARERWTVSPTRNGVRLVTDSVSYSDHTGLHLTVLAGLVVC